MSRRKRRPQRDDARPKRDLRRDERIRCDCGFASPYVSDFVVAGLYYGTCWACSARIQRGESYEGPQYDQTPFGAQAILPGLTPVDAKATRAAWRKQQTFNRELGRLLDPSPKEGDGEEPCRLPE